MHSVSTAHLSLALSDKHATRHRRLQKHWAKRQLTNFRLGIPEAVDLKALMPKYCKHLPALNKVIHPLFP